MSCHVSFMHASVLQHGLYHVTLLSSVLRLSTITLVVYTIRSPSQGLLRRIPRENAPPAVYERGALLKRNSRSLAITISLTYEKSLHGVALYAINFIHHVLRSEAQVLGDSQRSCCRRSRILWRTSKIILSITTSIASCSRPPRPCYSRLFNKIS